MNILEIPFFLDSICLVSQNAYVLLSLCFFHSRFHLAFGQTLPDGTELGCTTKGTKICYYVSNTRLPWEEAHAHCKRYGMNLASISNQHEYGTLLNGIQTFVNADELLWLGAKRHLTPDNQFRWLTSDLDYYGTVVERGQVKDIKPYFATAGVYGPIGTQVVLFARNNSELNRQETHSIRTPCVYPTRAGQACGASLPGLKLCYDLYDEPDIDSWYKAVQYCSGLDQSLIDVGNSESLDVLNELFIKVGAPLEIWIGLRREVWVYYDRAMTQFPMAYYKWDFINLKAGDELAGNCCAISVKTGLMQPAHCGTNYFFICDTKNEKDLRIPVPYEFTTKLPAITQPTDIAKTFPTIVRQTSPFRNMSTRSKYTRISFIVMISSISALFVALLIFGCCFYKYSIVRRDDYEEDDDDDDDELNNYADERNDFDRSTSSEL